ncbi:MAG: DUF86 domain-containing protein [Firmicutes bacterium]|nr:DUF86 domain-containing protein [Bacillota bacterium]
MITKAIICNKLKVLLKYYQELKQLSHGVTLEIYCSDLATRRSIERQIQLIVELGTDVNNMLLKKLNLGSADYFNSFIDLAESGVLEPDFALKIAPSTGLRNILVHEYTKIDDTIVYQSIADVKHYYGMYLKVMAEYLECDLNHSS